MRFPVNFVTAPLIADLFLLAILAIGRKEVHDGTVGADHIFPIDIMLFFITLAYIAISIDASGLIRWLAYKVLQIGGKNGHRLYFYLYLFFFGLATLIGNDPIILSGTPFLAYMTRVSSNIQQPKAWIFTQFAVANIASAILVSSNPTNLVLAGAFNIKFITYTANIIVPVVATAIVLFPFLLYVLFRDDALIPGSIELHDLPDEVRSRQPANPNIPYAKGAETMGEGSELTRVSTLVEILNPYLDKTSAIAGSVVMIATLVTILALNASTINGGAYPAYWVTLPAAFIMFCFDVSNGWIRRETTRALARRGKQEVERARSENQGQVIEPARPDVPEPAETASAPQSDTDMRTAAMSSEKAQVEDSVDSAASSPPEKSMLEGCSTTPADGSVVGPRIDDVALPSSSNEEGHSNIPNQQIPRPAQPVTKRRTLASLIRDGWEWSRETFPTTTTVLSLLPINLVPFALCMFVLVQALVTKGWVAVFAYGWNHWINATGTVGAIGGMAFLSVVLCNFAGTNIGTTILLCRVIQAWVEIRQHDHVAITDRTFWATVYSMAIGVNYGAFSTAFSASLAGLLWRDILSRKNITVGSRQFAWVNLPIIVVTMVVGCAVLVGEIYIIRNDTPYES
jgi:Na+/H+ antiporter NhaD/arsenite permease-like protein